MGVNDFGIYNLVGGFIFVANFISNSMALSVDRFLAYNLGLGNQEKTREVFSMAVNIHIFIAIIIFVLAETIGLWIVNNTLVIPADRMLAANVIYQSSIISFILFIVTTPYNSDVIANERMGYFALVGILQGVLKLVAAIILPFLSGDRLIIYALLMIVPSVLYFIMNYAYTRKQFQETRYRYHWNKALCKDMSLFAGYSTFGNMATAIVNWGQSILLNLFFGPVLNTVRGLSMQVNIALTQFVNGIYTAINPQIIKSYAQKDRSYFESLVFQSTKLAYYMLFVMSLPIFLEINPILHIWLKEVPAYTDIFIRLFIVNALIYNFVTPTWMAIQATGNVARIQLATGIINLLNLVVTYILWKLYALPPYSIIIINIIVSMLMQIATIIIQSHQLAIPITYYMRKVIVPVVSASVVALIVPVGIYSQMESGLFRFVVSITTSLISCILVFYSIGIGSQERIYIKGIIQQKLHRDHIHPDDGLPASKTVHNQE